jgi:hypothetical protein
MPDEAKTNAPAQEPEKEMSFEEAVETPEVKFTILVSSLATQVLVSLGQIENPLSKKKQLDLKSAKFSIDLLQMLADKTRGNLSDVEKHYLEGVLYKLRMGYVEASK